MATYLPIIIKNGELRQIATGDDLIVNSSKFYASGGVHLGGTIDPGAGKLILNGNIQTGGWNGWNSLPGAVIMHAATDENLVLRGKETLTTGTVIQSINDALSANQPLEFRTSYNAFTVGGISIGFGNNDPGPGGLTIISPTTRTVASIKVQNLNPNNVSRIQIINDAGTADLDFGVRNSTIGAYGDLIANDGYIYSPSNITLIADAAGKVIKFLAGGNAEKARISSAGLIIGGGTAIAKVLSATATLDFPNTGTVQDLTVTVTGAAVGDPVFIGVPHAAINVINSAVFFAWVSAADTVTVRFMSSGAGSSDPASGTYRIVVFKF